MSDSKDIEKDRMRKITLPSQIPLLEDVISDLTTTSDVVKKNKRAKHPNPPELDPLDKPLATDLFGDPIHSYAVNPDNSNPINEEQLHSQATEVVNSLVKEYSHEIVRRLRNELTSVLNDLNEEKSSSRPADPPTPSDPEQ